MSRVFSTIFKKYAVLIYNRVENIYFCNILSLHSLHAILIIIMKQSNLRLEWLDPKDLAENPNNWRRHPRAQKQALESILQEVGWTGALLYNEATGRLIDGHLRRAIATDKVPVLIGSWTEDQERLILATLDPIAAMAQADKDSLVDLLASIQTDDKAIADLLEAIANDEKRPLRWDILSVPEAAEIAQAEAHLRDDLRAKAVAKMEDMVELICPACAYRYALRVKDILNAYVSQGET